METTKCSVIDDMVPEPLSLCNGQGTPINSWCIGVFAAAAAIRIHSNFAGNKCVGSYVYHLLFQSRC